MPNPDLILHNAHIYEKADSSKTSQAIAVWNGQVTAIGNDTEILRLKARPVKTIDAHGKTVIPGLTDSHIHLLGYAMSLRTLDLSQARSIKDIQTAVIGSARKRGDGWIVGRGWDQEKLMENRYPTKDDFSSIRQPVFLRRICGHIAVANARALSLASINKNSSDPKGGVIERDRSTRELTGVLKESAQRLVQEIIPWDEAEVEKALVTAAKSLLRLGLTSLHCIIENILELKVLRRLKAQGRISQSIYAIIPLSLLASAASVGLSTERARPGFRIGGVKMFLDGSLGARTAALIEPYDDGSTTGIMTLGGEHLLEAASKAVDAGFQLSMHAIGDRAVREALTVVKKVGSTYHGMELRHRIEHASLTPPELMPMFRKQKIIASIQPSFIPSDTWAEKRLGPRRIDYLYPFNSMIRAGIRMTAGSDCPVENPNPFRGIWAAAKRPGLPSNERINVPEALACYTSGPAYASFAEEYQGTLEPGKFADMLVLDRDPIRCSTGDLAGVKVLETFVAGSQMLHS